MGSSEGTAVEKPEGTKASALGLPSLPPETELASPLLRAGANLVEALIAALLTGLAGLIWILVRKLGGTNLVAGISVAPLGLAWLSWLVVSWSRGRSPGKQLVNTWCVDVRTGQVAPFSKMMVRELVGRYLLMSVLGVLTLGIAPLVLAFMLLWDKRQQQVWDKVAGTIVVAGRPTWIAQYFLDFRVLRENPPAFWAIQLVNLVDSIAYFALLGIVTLFLSQNIALDKVSTGYVVTTFTTFITVSLFVAGFVTDSLGIKKSLFLAQSLALGTRIVIAACGLLPDLPGRGWIVTAALVLMAPGAAMTQTVFQAANKRFSSKRSRSASFNIWYLIMNIGAMVGGFSIDIVRVTLNVNLSWIFIVGAIAAGVSVMTTLFFIHKTDQVLGEGEESDEAKAAAQPKRKGFALLKAVFGESAFWRFIVLMAAVLGVRAVFAYMYLLMPQYWVEVIEQTGSAKTDQGLLQAINPILIVFGLILFIPIANRFNVFKMLVSGAFISSCSLLVLALPWQWFGPTMAQGYFAMSFVMLIVLSIGELIWSPKLTEYTAAIAPPGQEGTYLGLSMMPWFVAKLAVSALSGHMLNRWAPSGSGLKTMCGGVDTFWDTPEAMWSLLFLWAVAGPIVALIFKGWLTAGADLEASVKSTAAAARKFRIYSAIAGVVVIASIGAFVYWNVSQPVPTIMGVDGKPLPPSVRTQKDADTCACYIADKAALGPQLCADAKPAGIDEEKGKEFRKECLTGWYADPALKCAELCAKAKDPAACAKQCPADAPKLAGSVVGFCAQRIVGLE